MNQAQDVKKVLWLALSLNLLVTIAKLSYGFFTGTLSVIADGFHSLADAGASVTGLIAVNVAAKPKDDDHHYGHQKFETLATLVIAAFIGITAWEVFKHGIDRIFHEKEISYHPIGILIMIMAMAINLFLSRYESKKSKEFKSHILEADAYHTASDFWVSSSVLCSLLAIRFGFGKVDAYLSIGISIYFFFIAYRLVKETTMVLSDAAFVDVDRVKKLAKETEGVISCHHVRTRGRPGTAFVDLHIQVDPDTNTIASHKIAHDLEDKIMDEITGIHDVLIHTEPYPDPFDHDD